ncbi:MAG: hypothetical protein ABII98_02470, partial [bacterium]
MLKTFNKNFLKKQALKFFFLGLFFCMAIIWLFGNYNLSNAATSTDGQNISITVSSSVPFHCNDSVQNFDETNVDCGGVDCAACPNHCTNSIQDEDETGVDCGGSLCPACPNHCTNSIKD